MLNVPFFSQTRQTLIQLEDSRLTTIVHRDFIDLVYVFQPLAERQMGEQQLEALQVTDEYGVHLTEITLHHEGPLPLRQVWSLTQFYSVDFSQSRIGVKKCVFYKRTIKVCVSCC